MTWVCCCWCCCYTLVSIRRNYTLDRHKGKTDDPREHDHKIPKILIFTHYKNILDASESILSGNANSTTDTIEELALSVNVKHSIHVHKESSSSLAETIKVLFWTDGDCVESIQRTRPGLVSYFKTETEGMYKADICRGSALLENGGFYLDVDVGVRHNLWKDLRPETEFVTAKVHMASNWVHKGFFQAILGAVPRSPILERYLELFERHYNGSSPIRKGPLGVLLLKRAWDEIRAERKALHQTAVPTELYQELLYHADGPLEAGHNKGVLSPAPTWGKRRACHFLVAGIANYPDNVEIVLRDKEGTNSLQLQVPVLSRIPGSRMCLEEADETNQTIRMESMHWWE